MSAEHVIRDDTPTPVATRPIERRKGVTYIGGTDVRTRDVADMQRITDHMGTLKHAFGLTTEQVEFAIRYEARKAKRRNPVARKLKANGRACKQRGYKAERAIVDLLGDQWERVPMSGALGGRHSGDVRYIGEQRVPAVRVFEVKRRRGGMATLTRWMAQGGGVDGVVIDPANGSGRLWVFDEAAALRLLDAAGLRTEVTP